MVKGRADWFFILSLFLLAGLISCHSAPSLPEKPTGDTLIIPSFQRPTYINPLLTSSTISANLTDLVYDGLMQRDEHYEPRPHLAESWERSEDGRTWTFQIRRGVKFHDGVELTAEDVAFTYKLLTTRKTKGVSTFIFKDVQSITVLDKYLLSITLNKPVSSFLGMLFMGVLPRHLLEGEDIEKTSFNQHPIGTGAFMMRSWSEKELVFDANPSYFLGRPYLDQIRIVVYPNKKTAWAKLLAGEVDFFEFLSPENYEVMKEIPAFRLHSFPG